MNSSSSVLSQQPVKASQLESSSIVLIDPLAVEPIRAELLGLERLESHARALAAVCTLAPRRRANSPLLDQFVSNQRILSRVHEKLNTTTERHGIDAEWLVDNFHIIDDSLREVRRDLPPGYDLQLPKLAVAPLAGYPRVYALALALVAHTDSALDEARIARFVKAFQEQTPLSIGELWALPTMLRLVLLENLRRLSEKMLWRWEETGRAERWAAEVSEVQKTAGETGEAGNGNGAGSATAGTTTAAGAAAMPPLGELSDPFVVRLLQLLRDQGRGVKVLEHLEDELVAQGSDPNDILRREQGRQAANQVTVGNCVLSLRLLSALDWNAFFEQASYVEAILREDPSGLYCATRLRHERPIPPGRRDDRPRVSGRRDRRGAKGRRAGRPRARDDRSGRPCGVLLDRRWPSTTPVGFPLSAGVA